MAIKTGIEITYDDDTGEVYEVKLSEELANEKPLFKADVLQDALDGIAEVYERELSTKLFPDWERRVKEAKQKRNESAAT